MPEDATSYIKRNAIQPMFAELLDMACKELPAEDSLTPYLLVKLRQKFPSAAGLVEVDAAALEWKPTKAIMYNKSLLLTYLENLRWHATLAALLERVLYERPKNVPAFLIELLAKGDVAPAGPDEMDDDVAAAKMQAVTRGRNTRKQKKNEAAAATKVQARQRGKNARKGSSEYEVPSGADASQQEETRAAMMAEGGH